MSAWAEEPGGGILANAIGDAFARAAEPVVISPSMVDAGRQVLGSEGDSRGYMPGGFVSALLSAWMKADSLNSVRLAQAFPDLGWAVGIARNSGVAALADLLDEVTR